VFGRAVSSGEPALAVTELVEADDQAVVETTRAAAVSLPGAAALTFRNGLNDHQAAAVFQRRPDGGPHEAALAFRACSTPSRPTACSRIGWHGRRPSSRR